jgi:hypothetical protein
VVSVSDAVAASNTVVEDIAEAFDTFPVGTAYG